MSEVNINYKGSTIASMDASGTKTLQTSGKYCEDDVEVVYTRPSSGGGYVTQDANGYVVLSSTNGVPTLINKTITENGTYNASSDNATGYSSVTVNVQASGGSMNISTNCVVNTTTYRTLTVSNVQSAPSKFVLVYDNFGSNTVVTIYQNCVSSISYDGTTTNAYCISGTTDIMALKIPSGVITWTYSSTQHTLTFSSSDVNYEFNDSTASSGYTLYYS